MQRFTVVSHNHGGHLCGSSSLRPRAAPLEPRHNSVLKLLLPQGSMSIGYADNTLIVAEAIVNEVQECANAALNIVSEHIRNLSLCLAINQTQAAMFTRRCGQAIPLIILQGEAIRLGSSQSYLSITLENKGTMFGVHLRAASAKARCVIYAHPMQTDAERLWAE